MLVIVAPSSDSINSFEDISNSVSLNYKSVMITAQVYRELSVEELKLVIKLCKKLVNLANYVFVTKTNRFVFNEPVYCAKHGLYNTAATVGVPVIQAC